ncbi:hypothetical protein D1AOALGA4SA_3089 [Olavius algarvensis Delta 1 endosymbiont]|nr:hypothetical protein D1AOALGA4SA_3089 [Olavius algarvensis Delta 1 endosymbiont]
MNFECRMSNVECRRNLFCLFKTTERCDSIIRQSTFVIPM